VSLPFTDGPVWFADFFSEFEALGGQVLLVQVALGFHLGDVVLDLGQGGTLAQWLHAVVTSCARRDWPGVVTLAASNAAGGAIGRAGRCQVMEGARGWQPGSHAERSVSVSAAARAFTCLRVAGVVLPGIRSVLMVAVRVFQDQVPATVPSMMTVGRASPIWLNARQGGRPAR
jgi:hypothetical protein